jgi:hypothetical protein
MQLIAIKAGTVKITATTSDRKIAWPVTLQIK